MPILLRCEKCGRRLKARPEFQGKRAECPECGATILIPKDSGDAGGKTSQGTKIGSYAADFSVEITDFLEPPDSRPQVETPTAPARKSVTRRMLEALLDPRAIQWLLMIGGGLAVLGLVIWLVSKGLFKDPRAVAVAMGIGSLAVLAAGWATTLKTRYRVAGQALTFLACVVAPLNLWFYHAQGLITLDNHLWIGGLVCVLLYAATVFVLRDGLFMYAVEAGVTLTVLLLLADLGTFSDVAHLSLWLLGLAFVSIHAERAFPSEGTFSRKSYGLPLFWSGHVQLGFSLLMLLGSQIAGWLTLPEIFSWLGNLLTENHYLAGGLWLVATYLYLYSDLVVRRIGAYVYAAAGSLVMAEITLLLPQFQQEGMIALLALTSVMLHLVTFAVTPDNLKVRRHLPIIAGTLAILAVLLGILLHIRATSAIAAFVHFPYTTGWLFVGVMLLTAATNCFSAYLSRHTEPRISSIHFFFSAAALLVAAAGLLRQLGWTDWSQQAPVVMLIPIAYILASRFWRSHSPETPLARVSHVATAIILASSFVAAVDQGDVSLLKPVVHNTKNLLLGLTFLEAALFYTLAGIFRRRSWNAYFAMAAACGALWQFLGYFGISTVWYELLYAVLGVVLLITARVLGLQEEQRYRDGGEKTTVVRGVGLVAYQCGNAVLSLALVIAFLKGLSELAVSKTEWVDLLVLVLTCVSAGLAAMIVVADGWKRWYLTAAVALLGVVFLQINVLVHLSGWRKIEIFCAVAGLLFLVGSHFGRFREEGKHEDDTVTLGLWAGSLLLAAPLFVAMLYHRFGGGGISLADDVLLLITSILMLTTGCVWRIKSTTLVGGGSLFIFLMIVIGSILYRPQVALGVYLFIGGGLIFVAGVLLSIYRERLLALPDQIAKREGLFRIISWR